MTGIKQKAEGVKERGGGAGSHIKSGRVKSIKRVQSHSKKNDINHRK